MVFGNSATTIAMTSCYGKISLYKEDQYKNLLNLCRGDVLFFLDLLLAYKLHLP